MIFRNKFISQKIRAATSVFVEDAILWWKYLRRHGIVPQTWHALKKLLRDEFVPKYHADYLLARLQRLKQRSRTVREYYHELKTRLLRCGLEEHAEATENRFLRGLNQAIQDLLVHKKYNSLPHLFILACKVESQIEEKLRMLDDRKHRYQDQIYQQKKA